MKQPTPASIGGLSSWSFAWTERGRWSIWLMYFQTSKYRATASFRIIAKDSKLPGRGINPRGFFEHVLSPTPESIEDQPRWTKTCAEKASTMRKDFLSVTRNPTSAKRLSLQRYSAHSLSIMESWLAFRNRSGRSRSCVATGQPARVNLKPYRPD